MHTQKLCDKVASHFFSSLYFRFHLGSYTIQNIISSSTSQFATKVHLLEVGDLIKQKIIFFSASAVFGYLEDGESMCYLLWWSPFTRIYSYFYPHVIHKKCIQKHAERFEFWQSWHTVKYSYLFILLWFPVGLNALSPKIVIKNLS